MLVLKSYEMAVKNLNDLAAHDPSHYALGESDAAPISCAMQEGSPTLTSTIAAAPSYSTPTLSRSKDDMGLVPGGNWCKANCPCFRKNSVC